MTMVYLIRHGIAEERSDRVADDLRSLTAKGIAKTQRVAQRLRGLAVRADTLLTSPLVRARQTAEILQAAGLADAWEAFVPLSPGGELHAWLTWLGPWQTKHSSHTGTLILVGHEPDLSEWAQLLVHGQRSDRWVLKKAGIIGLRIPQAKQAMGNSELLCLIPPRFLAGRE